MLSLKRPEDIVKMKKAGVIVADVLKAMNDVIRPGVDTMTLEETAEGILGKASAKAAFKGYRVAGIKDPFPAALCVSINDEIVHGSPSRDRILEEGDIVSIDFGAVIDGYYGDAACTYAVGNVSDERRYLMDVTHRSLHIGMDVITPGATIGDIGHAIEEFVLSKKCGLVRDYTGHGIGKHLHEAPQVPNHGKAGAGMVIKQWMTFCVEPMVMSGGEKVKTLKDGWTVVTKDGSDAAHFEHTLLVTEDGVEVLTPWE